MRIEVEAERFFAEVTAKQTVVGISADENCKPVLTVVNEGTDESIAVTVDTGLLERIGALIHLHKQWEGDQTSGSRVTPLERMRA